VWTVLRSVSRGSGLRERLAPALVVGTAAAVIPAVVHVTVGNIGVNLTARVHFYSVGFSALVAAAAVLGLTVMRARRGDTRTVLVGTAFAVMATRRWSCCTARPTPRSMHAAWLRSSVWSRARARR
jgi:hypothetical protein